MCSQETIENSWSVCECVPEAQEFVLRVQGFEALVDLEMALEHYLNEIDLWQHLSDRERETRQYLGLMLFEVQAMRKPITRKRQKANKVK